MIRKALPSLITSFNLIAGCVSVVYASEGNLVMAGILIITAAFFDFFDGMAARLLDSISEFGKQLDSLADVISFGIAPAMIIYQLLSQGKEFGNLIEVAALLVKFSPFLIAVFSALRLAKFNIDKDQAHSFKGLPTPANALLIAGFGFARYSGEQGLFADIVSNIWFLAGFIVLSCYLLVSNTGMFSLKFKSLKFRGNSIRYLFLIVAAICMLIFGLTGLSLVIILYILLSVFNSLMIKNKNLSFQEDQLT